MAQALRPAILEELALGAALVNLARRMGAVAGLEVVVRVPRALPWMSEEIELAIYRIAQEAMTNVVRHADASRAVMAVHVVAGVLTLEIDDDGVGRTPAASPGSGLKGMRDRARGIGAELVVRDAHPHGTALVLRVPLAPGSVSR